MGEPAGIKAKIVRIACAVAAATTLAACDKCGDFVPPIRFQAEQPQVCKDEVPQPR